jgi:PKD repeat protein
MSLVARRRRRRVFGAACVALLLTASLLVASSVGGAVQRAAAGLSGQSPGVYATGAGAVDGYTVANLKGGGASPKPVNKSQGLNMSAVALNSTSMQALAGQFSSGGTPPRLDLIDLETNVVSGTVDTNSVVIGLAMDPTSPDFGYALEARGLIDKVNISGPVPSLVSLPTTGLGEVTSIAISPDGTTLYIGWGNGDLCGVDGVSIANPVNPFPVYVCTPRGNGGVVVDIAVAPNGSYLYGAKRDGGTGSLAFAVPLKSGLSPWATNLPPGIPQPTPLVVPRSLTVSPNSQTVYIGGISNPGSASAVQALGASNGFPSGSFSVPIASDPNGSGGLTGIAVTPDSTSLMATGFVPMTNPLTGAVTDQTRVAVLDLSSSIASVVIAGNLTGTTGPQDIAITPDQAPVAVFSAASAVQVGHAISLNATLSQVAFGSITSFVWDFGDGSSVGAPGSAIVSHTYTAPGNYQVTLTETDSAGTGFAPVSLVAGPGQTPFSRAGPSARSRASITVTTAPPPTNATSTTTTGTTSPTSPSPSTTSTTAPPTGPSVPGAPKLILNPAVGPPGTIVTVTGTGFRPNTAVTVSWTVSTGSVVIVADNNGNLAPSPLLILTPDVLGPRFARASSTPPATAPFLVVPATSEPGGDNAGLLFRSEGP